MQLNFPAYKFKLKSQENRNYVFDIIRKKYVMLTPEEWVRQHLLHYLIEEAGYPASLIAVERGLQMNGLQKRFDILVFDKQAKPLLLVECKAPDLLLTKDTFLQAAVYNSQFNCPHILITNGIAHYYCNYVSGKPEISTQIPTFAALLH
jgi:hypothetical protein